MYVQQIWRYPVKSMAGERLESATLGSWGIEGDRIVYVANGDGGRVVTARTHPRLLGHRAVLGERGEPLVDGVPWSDLRIESAVQAIAGRRARLSRTQNGGRFDVLPLLVATDGAIAAFGYDGRRLRPNLVIGGVIGLDERKWPGHSLRIGDALVALVDLRARCVMTTFDPDTLKQDREVLQSIVDRFDGTLALNARVVDGGQIHVGDTVELLE
jgi:MOSC domain-containing protein